MYVPDVLHSTERYVLYIVLALNVTPVVTRSSAESLRNTTWNAVSVVAVDESYIRSRYTPSVQIVFVHVSENPIRVLVSCAVTEVSVQNRASISNFGDIINYPNNFLIIAYLPYFVLMTTLYFHNNHYNHYNHHYYHNY